MKHILKRILVITLITHLALVSSIFYNAAYSFAADSSDWENVTSNEQLVDAFKSYCKSRNVAIEGSVLDAVTSTTSTIFNDLCNSLGIDSDLLQAEIMTKTDNSGLKWLFTQTGLTAYNRLFAELLQNYDISVGDDVEDQVVNSGEWFTDSDGNGCFVYIFASDWGDSNKKYLYPNKIVKEGSFIKYQPEDLLHLAQLGETPVYNFVNQSVTLPLTNSSSDQVQECYGYFGNTWPYYTSARSLPRGGGIVYRFDNAPGYYRFGEFHRGWFNQFSGYNFEDYCRKTEKAWGITSSDEVIETNVFITTNNQTINNETVINEGDTYIINNDGEPEDDAGGSGSGGSGSGGTGSDTTIDVGFPNINLPDLGNIDWSLSGLSNKFPFCIPFDLYHFVDVLDAEPETPKFQGSINLIVTTWNLDYDLTAFDDLAAIVRNVEFIGFCIGLIFITRKIIKG